MKSGRISNIAGLWGTVILLLSVPGCGDSRLVRWGKQTFGQAEKVPVDLAPACAYLRPVRKYDLFNDAAYFDVLWLSDEVRRVYSELYAFARCMSPEAERLFWQRQRQEGKQQIEFYVLVPYDIEPSIAFNDKCGTWVVTLRVDGNCSLPYEVKEVDLCQEYRRIFGYLYGPSKVPYHIQFDAHDLMGNPLITSATRVVELVFTSARYVVTVTWDLTKDPCRHEQRCVRESMIT